MGLLSFLKRTSGGASASASRAEAEDTVQQARTRARQRLVGAIVLVGVGVVGFSMLLGSQPRPMATDIPIEIARRDSAAAPTPARRTPGPDVDVTPALPPSVVTENTTPSAVTDNTPAAPAPASEPKPVVIAAAPKPSTAPAPAPKPPEPKPVEPKPAESKPVEPKPAAARPAESARAQALLDGKVAAGRFVVQVGAFADSGAANEARRKVEKLGLKTYTQVVNTASGNRVRVRVGPFPTRDDAHRAAGKIKSAGLPSAVLTL